MIEVENPAIKVLSDESELPVHLIGSKTIYLDLETLSGSETTTSTNPWHNCWIAGICLTADDCKEAYYIPIGHYKGRNLNSEVVASFLTGLFRQATSWVNHNIKYDAHVLNNCLNINPEHVELIDTSTSAKIINSDMLHSGGYGLKHLSKAWLNESISFASDPMAPYLVKNKDYGKVPIDILGAYGAQDVITNRRLHKFIEYRMPDDCRSIWGTEIELTRALFDMERTGLKVDRQQVLETQLKTIYRMNQLDEKLNKILGRPIRAHTSEDCHEILCGRYGLPVLEWTEKTEKGGGGNPKFDKHVLSNYLLIPNSPTEVIKLILEYRELHTFETLFLSSFLRFEKNGRIHCNYNQIVRTGRMSCGSPNFQQANKAAKDLIGVDDGYELLDLDYSQIEYRTIIHYIENERCLAAYKENPDTDFHSWVKDMCRIHRRPAKTVNFLMGYGGGKATLVKQLMKIEELVGPLKRKVDSMGLPDKQAESMFILAAKKRGEEVYDLYHNALPELKPTSYAATDAAKARGYVRTEGGRRRHLPSKFAHLAFNAVNQGTAADIQKERTVAAWKYCKKKGIQLNASVHDNTLFSVPKEGANFQTRAELSAILENPRIRLKVPVRTAGGYSSKSWLDASKQEGSIPVETIAECWKGLKEYE